MIWIQCDLQHNQQTGMKCARVSFFLFRRSAILFNGDAKPAACWGGRSYDTCEKLTLTMVACHDQDSHPG